MSKRIREWLVGHKRQIAVHSVSIPLLVVYALLFAGPAFDRFQAIEGEARLCEFVLPAETEGMYCVIERIDYSATAIEVEGTAFIPGQDCGDSQTYLVLASDTRTYIFDTVRIARPYLVYVITDLEYDTDCVGFISVVPSREVTRGSYSVGAYIRKGDLEALRWGDKLLTI